MAKVKKAEQVNAVQDLKTIMNHPMVILIVSPDDGRIWAANTAAAQFYGWSIERLSQMHINELNALLHEKSQTALELMLSQQRGFFECQHKLKDGQRRDVELHIAPILWDNQIALCSMVTDVTARKQSERLLRDSEVQFRRFIQWFPMPIMYATKHDLAIRYVNERFAEIIGYTLEELPTAHEWWLLAFPDKEYRHAMMRLWSSVFADATRHKKDIEAAEAKITCKDGQILDFLVTGIIMDDYFLVTFNDITELRHNEQLLIASYERKRKNELLNELIHTNLSSPKVIAANARIIGQKVTEPFDCYVAVMDSYRGKQRKYWLDHREVYQPLIDSLIVALGDKQTIVWESPDGLGILSFGARTETEEKVQQIRQAKVLIRTIECLEPEIVVSIGVAERAAGLKDIGAHYQQAAISVHSGRKIWPQHKIFHYLDIGLLQLLPCVNDQKQIINYTERTLGKLLRQDTRKKVKLFETLESIVLSDNLKGTASNLSIHYKTLIWRKKKIEAILGVSLDNLAARMAVAGAVQLMKLYANKEE